MSIRTMVAQPLEATPRSNSYVTIQMRRGLESQMDKSKFLPAEFGATTDTKKLFFAFGAGDVQQLATYQNLEGLMAQALAGLEEEYLGSITQATQNAINATSQASSAATAANQAADEANEIIDAFKEAVDGTVISDSSPSSSTAYSSQKIENDFLKKTGNGSNVTVTFQQAADRAGIQSGDSLAVAFGKLAKFCADMQDYVFSPPVASLASTDATRPLAASMGKRLNDDFTAKYNNLNSALSVKVYPGEGQINGFESWAVVDNHTVTFCIRGTITSNLGTSDQYALVASFPKLKNLVTLNRLRLKRIEIATEIKGQIRFEQDTGILNIGYTYNNSGESIDIPKGTVLYLEETFVL